MILIYQSGEIILHDEDIVVDEGEVIEIKDENIIPEEKNYSK